MAESTNLSLLLTRHGHIIAGTEEETMCMEADTKEQLVVVEVVECCFASTETVGLLGTGAQDGHLDFHTAPEL